MCTPIAFKKLAFCFMLFYAVNLSAYAGVEDETAKGIEAFQQGNLILAMQLLNAAAAQGHAPAQVALAYIYDQAEEDELAFKWLQQAVLQDNAAGQFALSNMYAKGEGVQQDMQLAGKWLQKAAAQQHVPAMRAYAYALEYGKLQLERDINQAFHWFQRAAQAGDEVSIRRLAKAYRAGELGQKIDPLQANIWEKKLYAEEK